MKLMIEDIKLGVINAGTIVFSFTDADKVLRIALLVVTIAYTSRKLWLSIKNNKP